MKLLNEINPHNEMLPKSKILYSSVKHAIDIVISICFLTTLSPLFLLVVLLIKADSPGAVFYTQERIGLGGVPFYIIKFRTMHTDAEKNGPQWADHFDPRITKVGYYLRKYRIDEIPQFFNILRGEMSIIGPRPERLVFIEEFEKDLPNFRNRLQVKPGITGLAQINGGYELSPSEKLELDLQYIYQFSFLLDLKIFLKSIPVILFSKGWR
ncbi:lipopolysaccharide/colanic/teichoic acid biosynthesis glycosyltransferase [Bacillus sp. SORGH_AS 510]|uniref:sugar transferase n=1 Tax=Bacillus sp. SORGH_AS_0510 TaxID=3041771 RepID=UPI00277EFD9A|nr:sugar transferase [Bacillus sp. SORGH_AS_0510]MDQ1144165.1 lipopolysaccharide/colanic/teichoic acid biosynthesis glycosyltransferase [Bacillus sp. SORGH_AS_0510]